MPPLETATPTNGTESGNVAAKTKSLPKHKEGTRDTIESILFAFVLAFLFRTFEAEAFVIPTGSMAPTLYGRHKETYCTACGHHIVVGASHEVSPETGYLLNNVRLRGAVCANCGQENDQILNELAYNGDRILVNKFPYEFGEPHRWDVFVFKYPSEPQTNYIKRLVGLPGEKLRIRNGDLFQVEGQKEMIQRKDPFKQRALQIPVYDDTEPAAEILEKGWPERWGNMEVAEKGDLGRWANREQGWKRNAEQRSYSLSKGDSQGINWLRYRHYFAMPQDWRSVAHGLPVAPQARLVADFCGYNATIGEPPFDAQNAEGIDFGAYWVPDLTINFNIDITDIGEKAELVFELCEGTSLYRCRIQPKTGEAVLEEVNTQFNDRVRELAKGQSALKGKGSFQITYANVDDRLLLWVNNRLVDFGTGNLLEPLGATGNPFPTTQDLTPVGIAAADISATVSELLLQRDIYYRVGQPGRDFRHLSVQLARYLTDPETWGEVYAKYARDLGERTFEIPKDNFLAFGDNSPQSNDSRLWDSGRETVPRKFLVGKAFWIYWPHGVPFMNDGKGFPVTYHYQRRARGERDGLEKVSEYPRYTLPFYPQFDRMKRIR